LRIVDNNMLKRFRGPGLCELCGKPCSAREPHHVIAKGMGGGRQLDIRINLVAVGSTPGFECECHSRADAKAEQARCRQIIARREKTTVEAIEEACDLILRLDKHASRFTIDNEVAQLSEAAHWLAVEALEEAGKF
jgi:hypothetical protein